ncbi:hypothetical protein D3C80_2207150 [compost metagenome]
MAAAQAQRASLQGRGQAGQVEEAHTIDTTLEGLLVGLLGSDQLDPRIEESPQPTAL